MKMNDLFQGNVSTCNGWAQNGLLRKLLSMICMTELSEQSSQPYMGWAPCKWMGSIDMDSRSLEILFTQMVRSSNKEDCR